MNHYFAEFRYEQDNQLLYKADELVTLKRNQTLMLDFFLSKPNSVHSKDDLLTAVWGEQVVSEQVIFQTISQLRSILGAEAIKTFPKKGYKFELKLLPHPEVTKGAKNEKLSPNVQKRLTLSKLKFVIVFFIILLALVLVQNVQEPKSEDELINLHIASFQQNQPALITLNKIEDALSQHSLFKLNKVSAEISVNQAFSSPKQMAVKLNIPAGEWLLWGEVYLSKQNVTFNYGLSNQHIAWQGYIQADSVEQLPKSILSRLAQLKAMGILSLTPRKLDLNRVLKMLEMNPDDADLLLLAAKYHKISQQNDVALGYLQKLIRLEILNKSSPYIAAAHWEAGKIYKMRGQYLQAQYSLEAMSQALESSTIGPMYFQYIKTKAWLAYSETDHNGMYKTLEQGLRYFEQYSDSQPLLMFKLHILYSILSQKVDDDERKYHHLSQAQALLLKYQLDESNLAIVYYHFALFSKYVKDNNNHAKETAFGQSNYAFYLEKILDQARTKDNFWIHDEAIGLLIKYHLEHQDYGAADAILSNRTLTPKRSFLKAEILLAQKQVSEAIELYKAAFEQARIDYDTRTAIESALILYSLSKEAPMAQAEYLAFLEANAKDNWLREQLLSAQN